MEQSVSTTVANNLHKECCNENVYNICRLFMLLILSIYLLIAGAEWNSPKMVGGITSTPNTA